MSAAVGGVLALALSSACGSYTGTPSPAAPSVTGTWTGTGSDSFSAERVTWVLTQSGSAVSGTVEFNAIDPADGSCASCHKVKRGTITGTLSGAALSVSMNFPAGGDVPAPICVTALSGTASVIDRKITVSYSGTDSCEGTYSNGLMELNR